MSAKSAILKALIEGAITDLMVKTSVENVKIDDSTTLAAKLSEIITTLNTKAAKDSLSSYATTTALTEGLSGKADMSHTHEQADITGMSYITNKLADTPTNSEVDTKISTAIAELINGAPETYNTLKEISDYISAHADVVDTLTAAIGNKADASVVASIKTTVDALGALASLNVVTEDNLDTALKEKLNAASEGNHSHSNKALLDTYDQTNADIKAAIMAKHSHSNQTTLDSVTAAKVASWDSKGKFYASASQPSNLTENDLWAQIVE